MFLDIDVVITDISRSIESIISYSNHFFKINKLLPRSRRLNFKIYPDNHRLLSKSNESCHFIAQLGPHTVNTGVLLFRLNNEGESFLLQWIENLNHHRNIGLNWVSDQVSYPSQNYTIMPYFA